MNNETLANLAEQRLENCTGVLRDFRATHLTLFKQKGLHTNDHEAYRYTNLQKFMDALKYAPHEPATIPNFENSSFINLVFIDGVLQGDYPQIGGIKFSSIEESFQKIAVKISSNNPFSALHHAELEKGVVIEIAKNTKIGKPIRLVNCVSRSGLNTPTVILKLNAFSEASVWEDVSDLNIPHAFIGETYVSLDTGAKLEHLQTAHGSEEAVQHTHTDAQVGKDASYTNILLNLSGKLTRRNLSLELLESGANGESYILYLTNKNEHSDLNTVIRHRMADTTSNQLAKGILDGDSKGIFTGKIHIDPKAQRVASGQLNKNLLLSKKAQAHSQPQLEIFADDVKCSHGSTTGQLSDEEVFYFEARGIPADKARTLLAFGFALEVVQKLKHPTLRQEIEKMVMESLKGKFQL